MAEKTAVHWHVAIRKNDYQTVRDLVKSGCLLHSDRYHNSEIDIDFADPDDHPMLNRLLDSYDFSKVDTSNRHELRLLFAASAICNIDFVKRWKSHGFPFNVVDSFGNTPLHYAAHCLPDLENFPSLVQFLVESGVNPNTVNNFGSNALLLGFVDLVGIIDHNSYTIPSLLIRELVRVGVDVNACDSHENSALIYVMCYYCERCLELLWNFGADINILIYIVDDRIQEFKNCVYDCYSLELFEQWLKNLANVLRHATRMNVLKLHVMDELNLKFRELIREAEEAKIRVAEWEDSFILNRDEWNFSDQRIEKFRKECELEKEKMRRMKLDGTNSMLDLALKSESEIVEFAYKEAFQAYFQSDRCNQDFPIYSYLLNLQFQAAQKRKLLLPNARSFLKTLNLPLYDLCLDHILKQFSNTELEEFIDIMQL